MTKSIVGDPILWPGLVYSPVNTSGLIFALGSACSMLEMVFEEFSVDGKTAVCRKKTGLGWERVICSFSFKSSEADLKPEDADLLICWIDDRKEDKRGISVLELSRLAGNREPKDNGPEFKVTRLENIYHGNPSEDLSRRGESISEFEETVRQLDDRIKKLQAGH